MVKAAHVSRNLCCPSILLCVDVTRGLLRERMANVLVRIFLNKTLFFTIIFTLQLEKKAEVKNAQHCKAFSSDITHLFLSSPFFGISGCKQR